jgi:formate C-acetyltransferase
VDIKVKGNLIIEKMWSEYLPCPFLSLFIDDCIKNGKDYNSGGARYNTSYIQMVGIGSLVDSLTALKYHVYKHQTIQMEEFLIHLKENFEHGEKLKRDLIFKTPKYGNDDDYTDELIPQIFSLAHGSVDGRANMRGGQYHINFLPTTVHVYFGKVTGATPDGRSAFTPLSEGISPVQGVDIKGPTAVLKSASKLDHLNTGGTLLNQKFSPNLLGDEKGIESLVHLIRTYFSMGGHHIQFNIVDAKILHSAQKHPETYRDLVVRVAGYSDYFINLGKDLQDEIIKRTEHSGF